MKAQTLSSSRPVISTPITDRLFDFKSDVLLIGFFSFVANVLTLSPTLYMLQIFDRVLLSQSELTLLTLTLVIALFIAVMAFAEWVRARLLVRIGVRFDERLNSPIFQASFDAHLAHKSLDGANHFAALAQLRQFATGNGVIAFFDLPWTPVYLFILFVMHPLLGWVGIGFTLFLAAMAVLSSQLTSAHLAQAAASEQKTSNYLSGKLSNGEVIEAMGMFSNLKRHWSSLYIAHVRAHWQAQQRSGQVAATVKFVQYSQQSLILALGAWLAIRGELSLGAMIASNVLMGNALRPIGILVGTWKGFLQARQSYKDIQKLLVTHPDHSSGYQHDQLEGKVSIQDLSAYAAQREAPILDSIDLHFEPGELIVITGPSGAGKSTLARCIIGIWPSTSGAVLLDGVNIRDWVRDALGPRIGYLPQDIELLEGTVAENICRFGELNSAAILEASKRADIHDMILQLPNGYDTPIGQVGRLLSGGQRQRLGLARAIYGSPALIVLDEPGANLDDIGDAALIRVLHELKDNRATVFLITHQRHLIAYADRIIVMSNGQIVQSAQRQPGSGAAQSALAQGAR